MRFLVIITTAFFVCAPSAFSQQFIYFNQTFWQDTMNQLANAVLPLDNGHFLVAGGYTSINGKTVYLRRLDEYGSELWLLNLDNASVGTIVMGMQFIKTSDGNFALTYNKVNATEMDIELAKFDENGYTFWSRTYIDPGNEVIRQVIETSDGGFAIAGGRQYLGEKVKFLLLKTDYDGILEWDTTYAAMDWTAIAFTVQQTHDDGYILGGYAFSPATDYDMYAIRTNASGGVVWEQNYGGGGTECACMVLPLNSGAFLMTGCYEQGTTKYLYNAWLDEGGVINDIIYNDSEQYYGLQSFPIIKEDDSFTSVAFYIPPPIGVPTI